MAMTTLAERLRDQLDTLSNYETMSAEAMHTVALLESAASRIEELERALGLARQFIENGIELGFIRLPETLSDPAHDTLPLIERPLARTALSDKG